MRQFRFGFLLGFAALFSVMGSVVQAGSYGYGSRVTSSPLFSSSLSNSYSRYKMEGYNFRSHNGLHRVNYKRHFTLHRVYDRDRRSYRALRKLKK